MKSPSATNELQFCMQTVNILGLVIPSFNCIFLVFRSYSLVTYCTGSQSTIHSISMMDDINFSVADVNPRKNLMFIQIYVGIK